MKLYFLVFTLCVVTSCKKEEKVALKEDFVFTAGGEVRVKSFKFINDTVFVAENYPDNDYVNYFLLKENEKVKINDFLDSINKRSYKSEYIQKSLQDGGAYQFDFLNKKKLIYVYGFNGSYEIEELNYINKFATFLYRLDESNRIILNNKAYYPNEKLYWNRDVDFGNVERFILPEIPYDTIY